MMKKNFFLSALICIFLVFPTAKIFADEITLETVKCVELKNGNLLNSNFNLII